MVTFTGLATRICLAKNQWGDPDVSKCRNIDQIRLKTKAEELSNIAYNRYVNDHRDWTQMFDPESLVEIADYLDVTTNSPQPLLPNDVTSALNTLNNTIR